MPYSNIIFVKLRLDLFDDDRFLFDLNDKQKGLLLMLFALAGMTKNKIRNEIEFIKRRLNLKDIRIQDVIKIAKVYPMFKYDNGYWCFENFEEIHNYILGKSKGNPEIEKGIVQNKNKNKKENKNKTPGSFSEHQEKELKKTIAEKNHHTIDSEANKHAFENLVNGVAQDKSIKKPYAVALHRAAK